MSFVVALLLTWTLVGLAVAWYHWPKKKKVASREDSEDLQVRVEMAELRALECAEEVEKEWHKRRTAEAQMMRLQEVLNRIDRPTNIPDCHAGAEAYEARSSVSSSAMLRTVATQSQCRYTYMNATPRFVPLGEDSHGAWSPRGGRLI